MPRGRPVGSKAMTTKVKQANAADPDGCIRKERTANFFNRDYYKTSKVKKPSAGMSVSTQPTHMEIDVSTPLTWTSTSTSTPCHASSSSESLSVPELDRYWAPKMKKRVWMIRRMTSQELENA